jgi:hypothetical protein
VESRPKKEMNDRIEVVSAVLPMEILYWNTILLIILDSGLV